MGGPHVQTRDASPVMHRIRTYSKLPSFNELVRLAFGESGIIRSKTTASSNERLLGVGPGKQAEDDDGLS